MATTGMVPLPLEVVSLQKDAIFSISSESALPCVAHDHARNMVTDVCIDTSMPSHELESLSYRATETGCERLPRPPALDLENDLDVAVQIATPQTWPETPSECWPPTPVWLTRDPSARVCLASASPNAATACPNMMLQPRSASPNTRTTWRTTAAPVVLSLDRAVASQSDVAKDVGDCCKTSVLLRNLPDGFTRTMLMDVIRAHGLAGHVDFLYVPADFKNMTYYDYAFVNLSTPEAAKECLEKLDGFSWGMPSGCACEASWCTREQGLDAYIERYRNSRIMHETVDDEYKPAVFKNGVRIRFPSPTKKVVRHPRAPRLREDEGGSALPNNPVYSQIC